MMSESEQVIAKFKLSRCLISLCRWWKVKVKDAEDSEGGLVPAAYVEQVCINPNSLSSLFL